MHVRRALALAAALPLLLVGCSEEKEPTPKMPDPSPSAASSSSTPEATEEPEQESPEEFIRRWQAAGDDMQSTGDTSEYLRLGPKCAACKSLASDVEEIYKGGGSIEFAGSTIVALRRSGKQPATFDVSLRVPETLITRSAGGDQESLPAGEMKIRVILAESPRGWAVTHYGVL